MSLPYSDEIANAIEAARQRSNAIPADALRTPLPGGDVVIHRFSVCGEPVRLQAAAWASYVGRLLQVPLSREQVMNGYRGELDTWSFGDIIVLDSRTDPVVHARTLAKIADDKMRDIVFHVLVDGIIETTTRGPHPTRAMQFVPGILALDLGEPMHMIRPSWARVLAFFMPRAVVEAVIPDAGRLHGCVVGYHSPPTRLLGAQIALLIDRMSALQGPEAQTLMRDCAQLILEAFARQSREQTDKRTGERSALMSRMQRHVHDNLHHGDLSPESVMGAFKLSRPTLYRMFESEGGLAAYIRNCRLREAANELVDSPSKPVQEIADDLHFRNHSHFTRAFRRDYGRTPLEFRALGRDMLRV